MFLYIYIKFISTPLRNFLLVVCCIGRSAIQHKQLVVTYCYVIYVILVSLRIKRNTIHDISLK